MSVVLCKCLTHWATCHGNSCCDVGRATATFVTLANLSEVQKVSPGLPIHIIHLTVKIADKLAPSLF